ncbi:YcxB family protein [Candidatus Gracilibacteria bacterium]|nr:YcxB family protein [Candidatus Gracilibacteria bacterium]
MVIESTLSRQEVVRLGLWRYFQRPIFYALAGVAATLNAYAILAEEGTNTGIIMLAAWLPFLVFVISGLIIIRRRSQDKSLPQYQKTRFDFNSRGIEIGTREAKSLLDWSDFRGWKKIAGCYVLELANGQIVALSGSAISPHQAKTLESTLQEQLKGGPAKGVFDQ